MHGVGFGVEKGRCPRFRGVHIDKELLSES